MRAIFTIFLLLSSGVLAFANEPTGNLPAILNSFIAAIAKSHPELKTGITLWQPGTDVPDGHQVGRSKQMGPYTFRPKLFSELTKEEKSFVMKHPQLKAFIVSMRNSRIYPSISAASPEGANEPGWMPVEGETSGTMLRVRIDPEEMLKNRPTVLHPVAERSGR